MLQNFPLNKAISRAANNRIIKKKEKKTMRPVVNNKTDN